MAFWKKIDQSIKVIFGIILGILGFVFFAIFGKKPGVKDLLEQEKVRIAKEIEIAQAENEKEENKEKLEVLKKEEEAVREKIKLIESGKVSETASIEELDDFFDSRGF